MSGGLSTAGKAEIHSVAGPCLPTVASRMVVNRKAGSITLFSFDEDEGLSEHTAPYDAVVTILDGECEVWVAGKTFQMKEGETIIFPANAPHALSAITRFKMMLIMIRD